MRKKHILIVFKHDNAAARELAARIGQWLCARGASPHIEEAPLKAFSLEHLFAETMPDCAVVLGGDGTILGVARRLAGKTPIFGINFGRVGFLTSAGRHDWQKRLEQALSGETPERQCLAIKWSLFRNKERLACGTAINDLVLSRGALARLISVRIAIDNEDMGILRSDGLIACTPLGSAGYSASAGGPLLYPGMDALGLTPICPFAANVSPLVFPGGTVFSFEVVSDSSECFLTVDGQEGRELVKNDVIEVKGWPRAARFLGNDAQFFERLGSRGFILDKDQRR